MLPSASKKTNSSFFRFIGPKKWSAGLLQTSPTPLLWDVAEFRAVEKGLLSDRRSFFLVIWLSMVEWKVEFQVHLKLSFEYLERTVHCYLAL